MHNIPMYRSRASDIAARLNLRQVAQRAEWRRLCPACGYESGLVLTEKEGRALWWGAACQGGDDVTVAIRQASGAGGLISRRQPLDSVPTSRKTAVAKALWEAAILHGGTLVDRHLQARGLLGAQSSELRFHPAAPHPTGGRLPAMSVAIRVPTSDEIIGVHRTFLRRDGAGKADVEPARASLASVMGGAVMLEAWRPGQPLIVGEGIETSLSAARLIAGGAWSAVCCGIGTTSTIGNAVSASTGGSISDIEQRTAFYLRAMTEAVEALADPDPELDAERALVASVSLRARCRGPPPPITTPLKKTRPNTVPRGAT